MLNFYYREAVWCHRPNIWTERARYAPSRAAKPRFAYSPTERGAGEVIKAEIRDAWATTPPARSGSRDDLVEAKGGDKLRQAFETSSVEHSTSTTVKRREQCRSILGYYERCQGLSDSCIDSCVGGRNLNPSDRSPG